MSFFYMKPVKGDLPLHLLEQIVAKRMEYLQSLSRGDTPFYSEYLIEGSIHDNVGHFALCIVSALLKSSDFTQHFLHAEVLLFKQRLLSLSAYELRCFAKKLLQIIRKVNSDLSYMNPLQKLCRHILIKNIACHLCSDSHNEDCLVFSIKLHFKHCLPLIASRQVELSDGFASIPCGKWMQYFIIIYKQGLLHRISQSNKYVYENDPRMTELLMIVKKILPLRRYLDSNIVTNLTIDTLSRYFPPCMQNLHQQLRKKHRLSHNQRFYYSLFLKDIGMPVEEAIDFWKSEYSLKPSGSNKCMHTWAKDARKLVYGIRHMYGLEGGRKNYVSKNCQQIQDKDSSCQEGGCPFKSFDNASMLQILSLEESEQVPILERIFEYKKKKMYSSACLFYLKHHLNTYYNCDSNVHLSPVKYFTLAYKNIPCN